jgi:hypothetical protein
LNWIALPLGLKISLDGGESATCASGADSSSPAGFDLRQVEPSGQLRKLLTDEIKDRLRPLQGRRARVPSGMAETRPPVHAAGGRRAVHTDSVPDGRT